MTEYRLVTCWHIAAPLPPVFDAVLDSLHWPEWWPGAHAVTELAAGDQDGIGSLRRYCWKSRLPYSLCFEARTTCVLAQRELAAQIDGDLRGYGRWLFSHRNGVTAVRHEWNVCTTRCWMNLATPFARPLFKANHHALMRQGAEGLARRVDARLLGITCRELPRPAPRLHKRVPSIAVAAAGVAAGSAATVVQLALWWLASFPVLDLLQRDTRMAAAILLGPGVLPPPLSLDWLLLAVAGAVHFALSIAYALLLAPLAARLSPPCALAAGALFGLLLFVVNMYGFTALFPWFAASRDWATAAAHAVFGMTAAGVLTAAAAE